MGLAGRENRKEEDSGLKGREGRREEIERRCPGPEVRQMPVSQTQRQREGKERSKALRQKVIKRSRLIKEKELARNTPARSSILIISLC